MTFAIGFQRLGVPALKSKKWNVSPSSIREQDYAIEFVISLQCRIRAVALYSNATAAEEAIQAMDDFKGLTPEKTRMYTIMGRGRGSESGMAPREWRFGLSVDA
jgi:hypothetical protein